MKYVVSICIVYNLGSSFGVAFGTPWFSVPIHSSLAAVNLRGTFIVGTQKPLMHNLNPVQSAGKLRTKCIALLIVRITTIKRKVNKLNNMPGDI